MSENKMKPPGMGYAGARKLAENLSNAVDDEIYKFAGDVRSEAVEAETALILYRKAIRLGLFTFGPEALLLRALEDAEREISSNRHDDLIFRLSVLVGDWSLRSVNGASLPTRNAFNDCARELTEAIGSKK